MAHVITQACCNDASCLSVCPVNCIHPRPGEPGFATAEMLYIDPAGCIDCGACVDECPVSAIKPDDKLDETNRHFLDLSAAYYTDHQPTRRKPVTLPLPPPPRPTHIAVIGSGPSAFYAAEELLSQPGVSVDMFERLPTPYGLVRAGVAPDHQSTKAVTRMFAATAARQSFRYFLNVEVGRDVTLDELTARYDAVLHASGAAHDRRLGIDGEDLPGSVSATQFVAWYNGHPDFANEQFDLSGETAVIVGNGNVALDVARILVSDPESLASTDIADHALTALRGSKVREVVVLGRRGIAEAAHTIGEFAALGNLPAVDIVIDPDDLQLPTSTAAALADGTLDSMLAAKIRIAQAYSGRPITPGNRRIVMRYLVAPESIIGESTVAGIACVHNVYTEGVKVAATSQRFTTDTGLVIRAAGYRGSPIPGLPFDSERCVVPNDDGRVPQTRGQYVAGWIKRGPTGGIGMNRVCGRETARTILADLASGQLRSPEIPRGDVMDLLKARGARPIDADGWSRIDRHERSAGHRAGRPRVKLVDTAELEAAARRPRHE
ncbi:FAD-dependent oxidoreductase [Hoyosella altamirensis]|uniref:ferredoxin--NADP(+) reductase n=1 Tax=Hoyosella altamirensis TaxID=616997 RepID=A0A839RK71_9ACTN|nr:FAD-dependent oxidoreductase [Hoyosella altamirensis]MBB3036574.1 ferredoxin--NADP+ reductase [Hoyosella altamirensis]